MRPRSGLSKVRPSSNAAVIEQPAHALLNDIVAFAQDVLCRPTVRQSEHRQQCETFEAQLEAAIAAGTSFNRHLDNGAPLLLTAIDRALFKRHCGDEDGAARWESLIGHLMPMVRADAGAALMASREILK